MNQIKFQNLSIQSPESSTQSELHASTCVSLYQCVCVRLQPHLFAALLNEYKFYHRPPESEQNPTWSQKKPCAEPGEEHAEDLEASPLSLTASASPPAIISGCLCPQRMPCPQTPYQSASDTARDITVQSNFLWSNPCMLPSLAETERERQTERECVRERELRAGNPSRPEKVEWRERERQTKNERRNKQALKKSEQFQKRYIKF